jgi:flagellar basal-body rod protein FlgB
MNGLPSQIDVLSKLLDAADLRHRVIAQNVANVNTPGYRRQEVTFEDALAQSLQRGAESEFKNLQPKVVEAAATTDRADGNTVDIDEEMGRLNKNSILYRFYAQLMTGEIGTMRSAITGK